MAHLSVDDTPVRVIPRRRLVEFTGKKLAGILLAHCRSEGLKISPDTRLSILGIASSKYSITLCIDGD